MSVDTQLGKLLAYAEQQDERLTRIEIKLDTKVSRGEFERGIAEHAVIRQDVKKLELAMAESSLWRKIGDKVLMLVVGALVALVLKSIGMV